jgi:hypothetical protein
LRPPWRSHYRHPDGDELLLEDADDDDGLDRVLELEKEAGLIAWVMSWKSAKEPMRVKTVRLGSRIPALVVVVAKEAPRSRWFGETSATAHAS